MYGGLWEMLRENMDFAFVTFKKHPYVGIQWYSYDQYGGSFEIFYNNFNIIEPIFWTRGVARLECFRSKTTTPPNFGVLISDKVALHITPLQPLSSVIWHLASLHEVPRGPCPLSVEAMNLFCPPQTLAQLGVSSAFQRGS